MKAAAMRARLNRLGVAPPAEAAPGRPSWCRAELAGRLSQLSGQGAGAVLSMAMALVLDAQREGEAVAWLTVTPEIFFPPDAAAAGVDLEALSVIRAPGVVAAGRAATHLLRSGAFGVLILDLGHAARLPMPVQARLVQLARRHGAVVLCLTATPREGASLGSLVSLRAQAERAALGAGRFKCTLTALKDKRRGPGWTHEEICEGPPGLQRRAVGTISPRGQCAARQSP